MDLKTAETIFLADYNKAEAWAARHPRWMMVFVALGFIAGAVLF